MKSTKNYFMTLIREALERQQEMVHSTSPWLSPGADEGEVVRA